MSAYHEILIEGQRIQIPVEEEWDGILESGLWNGGEVFSVSSKVRALELVRFVRAHPETFSLGLFKLGAWAKEWTLVVLLRQGGIKRQVHIERVRCERCGTVHIIANPTIADFFFASNNKQEALKQAFNESSIRCLSCGASLPRPAMWAEIAT